MYRVAVVAALQISAVLGQLTFRNVLVSCDNFNEEELSFATVVTGARLKPHLPDFCEKITISHATVPVLTPGSCANIKTNVLLLEHDEIGEIEPGAFRNLEVAEGLSVKSNRLGRLQAGVFNQVKTPTLYLSENQISYIDGWAFDNMTTLENLHLDRNHLGQISEFWFQNVPRLKKLNLAFNQIREVQRFAFRNLASGVQLDLSWNQIWRVDGDAFKKPRKFALISLAHNQISSLERSWMTGVQVGALDLVGNRISCLGGGLAAPPSVNYLDGNPWSCECFERLRRQELRYFGRIQAPETVGKCS